MVNYQSLIGHPWKYGFFDCWTVVQKYYKLLGIDLPDQKRPKDIETCESLYFQRMPEMGFYLVKMERRLPNDVLVMQLGTQEPMHAAILLDGEQILHQKMDSLSCTEHLGRYYQESTKAVFRYAAKHSTA